jgi:hypothetical protein
MKTVRLLALPWILAVCAASACVTTAYQGPARPRDESVTLSLVDTVVEEIDGNDVASLGTRRLRFSLPPGPHVVWLRLHKVSQWYGTPTLISGHTEICLDARAGGRYVIKGVVDKGASKWNLVVSERGRTEVETGCSRERLFPGASAAAQPPAPVPATGVFLPATEEMKTIALDLPSPSPPPLPLSGARDVVARWRGQPLWRPPARPLLDVAFNAGGTFAAFPEHMERLPDALVLHSAFEITTSVGVMVTPLWLHGDGLGLGVGSDLELRNVGTAAPDASLSFWRMPATGTVHALIRTHPYWFLLLAGGVEANPIAHVTRSETSGALQRSFSSELGWVARIGAYRHVADMLAVMMGLGYSHLEYGGVDASRIDVWLGLHASVQRPLRDSDVPGP